MDPRHNGRMRWHLVLVVALVSAVGCDAQGKGNRLAYLVGSDPYYVSLAHPRLTTPQWIGEAGVEAVVTLAPQMSEMRGRIFFSYAFCKKFSNRFSPDPRKVHLLWTPEPSCKVT